MRMKDRKFCKGCNQWLVRSAFYTKGHSKVTGKPYLTTLCIECFKIDRAGHRDRENALRHTWTSRHKDEFNAFMRKWRKEHPGYHDHEKATYRQYGSKSGRGRVRRDEWQKRIDAFGGCAYCGCEGPLEVDHFIPRIHGGSNDLSNLVPACRYCNASKGDTHPENFLSPELYAQIVDVLSRL